MPRSYCSQSVDELGAWFSPPRSVVRRAATVPACTRALPSPKLHRRRCSEQPPPDYPSLFFFFKYICVRFLFFFQVIDRWWICNQDAARPRYHREQREFCEQILFSGFVRAIERKFSSSFFFLSLVWKLWKMIVVERDLLLKKKKLRWLNFYLFIFSRNF